jgi:sugar lactone lactonase YvrE
VAGGEQQGRITMGGIDWEVVVSGYGRLEAPCFDLAGRLCFTDMEEGGAIYCLDSDSSVVPLVRGRAHVGGLVPHLGGGLVATGSTVAVLENGAERVVLEPEGGWGFNDLTTDRDGNVYVGMHGERPTANPPDISGSLWRIGVDGTTTRCYAGIKLTNGIRISPDGTVLYHADTLERAVWISDLSAEGGVTNRRLFFELPYGMPDGMAMDETGCLWIAAIGDGVLFRIRPDGGLDSEVQLPMSYPSAVCFGGPDGRGVYVTTFGAPYEPGATGSVLFGSTEFAGAPVYPARI